MNAPFGQFGDTFESFERSGFVKWFQLEKTGESSASATVIYRPSGEAFRSLVAISADAPTGTLRMLELRVARSFIDDGRQGMFARDIIKSFVEAVSPPSPASAALANEIMFRSIPGPVFMRGEPPTFGDAPSPVFLVVAGQADRAELIEGLFKLSFANKLSPEPHLAIKLER